MKSLSEMQIKKLFFWKRFSKAGKFAVLNIIKHSEFMLVFTSSSTHSIGKQQSGLWFNSIWDYYILFTSHIQIPHICQYTLIEVLLNPNIIS